MACKPLKRCGIRLFRRGPITVGTVVLAVAAPGGVAYAAIPSSASGVITACAVKQGGALWAIGAQAGDTCRSTESTMRWNTTTLKPRGVWASGVMYKPRDSVSYAGNSYVALRKSTNGPPTVKFSWQSPAARGAVGPTGATGAAGADGEPGARGRGGPAPKGRPTPSTTATWS